MQNVLVAAPISKSFEQFLLKQNANLLYDFSDAEIIKKVQGIITSTKLKIDKTFIDQAIQLKWIARLGSGMEIIDANYAKSKQIFCCSSPAGIANAVAEHTIAMIIALQKNIIKSHFQITNFNWIREENRGTELEHKTIGIIGCGHTGQKVIEKLAPFNMTILVFDKYKKINLPNVQQVTLEQLYEQAQIVSYHIPYNQETDRYYQSSLFKLPHYLINTSRGKITYTQDILNAFASNHLLGAALDVLDFENQYPFNSEHKKLLKKLLSYNTIITPHIAGYTFNAIEKMSLELQNQLVIAKVL